MARESKTRYAILGMLAVEPMTGYRLREAISQSIGHFWHESFGQLYPALGALEGEGLVRRVAGVRSPYAITGPGRTRLAEWLAEPPDELSNRRSELLLKIFFGRFAAPGVIAGHLAAHRAKLEGARESYAVLGRRLDAEPSADVPYWRITLDHGAAMVDAALAWTDAATQALAEMEREAGR